MIDKDDLTGVEELLAVRLIAVARSIAPCVITLPEGPDRKTAIAILRGIAGEAKSRGSLLVKGQRIGPAGVDYSTADSWFSSDDRAALKALCLAPTPPNEPIGRFPRPGIIARLWPEDTEQY